MYNASAFSESSKGSDKKGKNREEDYKYEKQHKVFLSWSCPPQGWYKLNVDGTVHKKIGGGGVIRNQYGQWMTGFAANLGYGKAIDAELSALHKGLELAWNYGFSPLEVETDNLMVLQFLMNEIEVVETHPQFHLVKSCQGLINQSWTCSLRLRHVYREQNMVADCLAKLGLKMEPGTYYFGVPPPACLPLLVEDQCGFARPRLVTSKAMHHRGIKGQITEDPLASGTFRWKIDNFSQLNNLKYCSDVFVIGDLKWRILVHPMGNNASDLSVYLDVPDASKLPFGWSTYAKFSLTIVNQVKSKKSITKGTAHVFSIYESEFGFQSFIPLSLLFDLSKGFLVDGACIVQAEVAACKANANIFERQSSGFYAPLEPSEHKYEGTGTSNVDSVRIPNSLMTCKAPSLKQVPAYQDAQSFEQVCTKFTALSMVQDHEDVSSV